LEHFAGFSKMVDRYDFGSVLAARQVRTSCRVLARCCTNVSHCMLLGLSSPPKHKGFT
jgi:hypothetical protein